MKILRFATLALLATVLAALLCLTTVTVSHAADYIIKFGIMRMAMENVEDGGGYVVAKETNIIPKDLDTPGFRYGFTIQSTTSTHPVVSFCELVSPPLPEGVKFSGFSQLTGSPNTFRTEKSDHLIGDYNNPTGDYHWIYYYFELGQSTPLGDYLFRVFVDGKLIKEIPFRIVGHHDVEAAVKREQGLRRKYDKYNSTKLKKESQAGVVFGEEQYLPYFDPRELGPSPISGLPSAFQIGEYYIRGDAGPDVENLAFKIYRDESTGRIKLEIWNALFGEKYPFEIVAESRRIEVEGKEIPLVGKILLGSGTTIEIVSYRYPYVGIIARNFAGEPWGQFFKKLKITE